MNSRPTPTPLRPRRRSRKCNQPSARCPRHVTKLVGALTGRARARARWSLRSRRQTRRTARGDGCKSGSRQRNCEKH
eukprot:6187606-Pleurochrysis_carterae.AAC.1